MIFDGDKQLDSTAEKQDNINKNNTILELFGKTKTDYPDGTPKDKYLGFKKEFENSLGFDTSKRVWICLLKLKRK